MPTGNYISLNVKDKDVAKLIQDLSYWKIMKQVEVKRQVATSAYAIEGEAKRNAPVAGEGKHGGFLRARIFTRIAPNELGAANWSDVPYAPYQEFGTGSKVNVPPTFEDFAIQFKGRGIRQVNIKAKLFLYKAWKHESKIFFDNVKRIMGIK